MKKTILTSISALLLLFSQAQVVTDTVSTGAGYANQKWYSLQNDEQGSAAKNNWDLAFDVSGYGTSIHINSVIGTQLWKYPFTDTAGWSVLDTAGIASWPKLYNSDTSWSVGAFDKGMVTSDPYDLGWGVYNSFTHIVTADSLYVIKLSSGLYKKLWIENLSGGAYQFKYADISGTGTQNATLIKSVYSGKNFGYYSLQANTALDREPASANWDLLFTQYTTFIPSAYGVSGILSNKGVKVATASDIGNVTVYNNWSAHTFVSEVNEIGYDWKSFSGTGYDITDSLIYFVKTNAGDIWKVIPTGFGGSASGNFMFSKEKLNVAGIADDTGYLNAVLSVYPNPSCGGRTTIVYDLGNDLPFASLSVYDLSGRNIHSEELNSNRGLHVLELNTSAFNKGMYFITIDFEEKRMQQKLIIQ